MKVRRRGGHFVNLKFDKLILKRNSIRGALFFHVSQVSYLSKFWTATEKFC